MSTDYRRTSVRRSIHAAIPCLKLGSIGAALLLAATSLSAGPGFWQAATQADFLRGVTHDLQTPLTSIGALATELRADDALPQSARTDLDTITHQAERLRRMVS